MAFKCNSKSTSTLQFLKLFLFPFLFLPMSILVLRFLIPLAADVTAATLPSLRSYLAPPYLFVTINFLIFTVWKLSEKGNTRPSEKGHTQPVSYKPKQVVVSFLPTKEVETSWCRPPPATEERDPIPVASPESPVVPVTPTDEDEEKETGRQEEEVEEEEVLSIDDTWRKITASRAESLLDQDDMNRRYEALARRVKNEPPQPRKLRS